MANSTKPTRKDIELQYFHRIMRNIITMVFTIGTIQISAALFIHAKEVDAVTSSVGLVTTKPTDGPFIETDHGFMVPYSEQIPGTDVTFEMIPIAGGEFFMGSPASEAGRSDDEGPQVKVRVPACWVGKCEVTWAEYRVYMITYSSLKSLNKLRVAMKRFGSEDEQFESLPTIRNFLEQESLEIDGVTAPTPLYDPDTTHAAGQDPDHPAVTMSQYAAKQYTKWLSGITGQQYRLPTEAEWEYAARAGTTTPYSFAVGEKLSDYAWFAENSASQLNQVGMKKPNAWGLHDMHGNVAEWVLDEYAADHYSTIKPNATALQAVHWPTQLYPRVIRGGCWYDDPSQCRSAARRQSDDEEWTFEDPNLPVSPWWFTEKPTSGIGFRIVRPLEPMNAELKQKVWDADIEQLQQDVTDRLTEGRGTQSAATPQLPSVLKELKSAGLVE